MGFTLNQWRTNFKVIPVSFLTTVSGVIMLRNTMCHEIWFNPPDLFVNSIQGHTVLGVVDTVTAKSQISFPLGEQGFPCICLSQPCASTAKVGVTYLSIAL